MQEHYLRVGIFSVFLAYRKSLEIVKDRKNGRFFFLKEKKVHFPLMHILCRNLNGGNTLLHGCLDGEGAAPVDNSGKLLTFLSEIT